YTLFYSASSHSRALHPFPTRRSSDLCDTAFIILSPLNRALSKKAGVAVVTGAVALSLGLYVTHTMVPPTPGPVAAAGILEADLRSEEHTSELQSRENLVCRLLLEKKK